MALRREAGSLDVMKVQDEKRSLRSALNDFDVRCIFNVDKRDLFFKFLPSRIYVTDTENKETVRVTKAMKAKYKTTAYACTSAVGDKILMAIDRKATSSRCFQIEQSPVLYFSLQNA